MNGGWVMQLLGGLTKMEGSLFQGWAESYEYDTLRKMELYNMNEDLRNARAMSERTRYAQIRQEQEGQRKMGELTAQLGASGADISSGAPLDIMTEQASELALENALIGIEGRTKESQYESEARQHGTQAFLYRVKSTNAKAGSYLQAGSDLLSSFGGGGGGGGGFDFSSFGGG